MSNDIICIVLFFIVTFSAIIGNAAMVLTRNRWSLFWYIPYTLAIILTAAKLLQPWGLFR